VREMISSPDKICLTEEGVDSGIRRSGVSLQEIGKGNIFLEGQNGKEIEKLEDDADTISSKEG
jgi:hypothetical protein